MTFRTPASRISLLVSRSRSKTSSVPEMLNKIANVATKTAVTMPAHDSSTESQSAPPSASSVQVFQRITESNDPSSHFPPRTSSIEDPVTTIPDHEHHEPDRDHRRDHERALDHPHRDQQHHAEHQRREPVPQRLGIPQVAQGLEER